MMQKISKSIHSSNKINWDLAKDRNLTPPAPKLKPIIPTDISPSIFEDSDGLDDDKKVPGWSFGNKSDISNA